MAKATSPKLEEIDYTKEKTYVFQLLQKVQPRGVYASANNEPTGDTDPPYPPRKKIKNPCLVYDESTGKERWLRLLQGYASVWQDEQDYPQKIEPSRIEALLEEVMFVDGVKFVSTPNEKSLLEFLMNHDDNGRKEKKHRKSGRPPIFSLLNEDVSAEDELEKMDERDKAVETIKSIKNIRDVIDHVHHMGVKTIDSAGQPLSDAAILLAYRRAAEARPKVFNSSFDSPLVKLKFQVTEALSKGLIDLEKIKGQAHWSDTGALITVLDITKDTVENLTQFALSKEGKDFKKRLTA